MCLIILASNGKEIKEDYLVNGWENNSHGAGYMFIADNEVCIRKGFVDYKTFYNSYIKDKKENKESSFIVHFRKVSRGKQSKENTHPFYTHNKKVAIAHNGTITKLETDANKSDTSIFAKMLSSLNEDWHKKEVMQILISNFIGNDRMVVMAIGNVWTYGTWITYDDLMFSNESYKKKEVTHSNNYSDSHYYSWNGYAGYENTGYFCSRCGKYLTTYKEMESKICNMCINNSIKKCICCEIELNGPIELLNNKCNYCMDREKRRYIW
jgi:predicted glutamine amidotransferase